jgi:asparagine synthase (glutamine-hydrolysing)
MANSDGRWLIVFNGEIYNFLEVKEQLKAKGVTFRGRTDTEVLAESIAFWGTEALTKLDGAFAFAAFDTHSGELILARDPFGEKPLYYLELPNGGLAFASELQALEKLPNFDAEVNLDAMAELLMFQYIGAPRTIYMSVKKLPPGHWMRVAQDQPSKVGRYFEFSPGRADPDVRPLPALADELEDILLRSIRRRLISDVPLGAFLSGGVDSSTVCALIRKKLGLPLETFSIGFRNAPESEHKAARRIARRIGCNHHDQILSADTSAFLLDIGRILDEPNADSSCMPTYLLSAFARRKVTVAVSGDGGDELFAGYERYFATLEDERLRAQTDQWDPGKAYYSNRILVWTENHIDELFGIVPDGLRQHVSTLRREMLDGRVQLLSRMRKTDAENYMPGAVLPKVDRMSMQHSLEVRTPFLNVELAKFAERLPVDSLYRHGRGKIVLRELAYRYIPREFVDAPKRGFGIPMVRWGQKALVGVASRLLEGDDARLRQVLGVNAIQRFMDRQRSKESFSTYQVWSLAALESWLRHHPAKLTVATETLRAMQASGRRSYTSALFALPLGEKEFGVLEDSDEMIQASGHLQPMKLPPWGMTIDRQDVHELAGLRGAKLIFYDSHIARKLNRRELKKYLSLGVTGIEYPHPHLPGTIFRLGLIQKNFLQRLLSMIRLQPFVVARLRLKQRLRLILHLHQGKLRSGRRLSFGPLGLKNYQRDQEMSHQFMLFEGLQQMPPMPVFHKEIEDNGNGLYSVWNDHLFFSPIRFRRLLTHPYIVVEQTAQTAPYLQYTSNIVSSSSKRHLEMATVLDECIQTEQLPLIQDVSAESPVVVFTHGLPAGGAERQWCYLAIGLQKRQQSVVFVSMNELSGVNAHYLPMLNAENIRVIELQNYQSKSILWTEQLPPSITRVLLRSGNPMPSAELLGLTTLLRVLKPKAVIAQLDYPNLLAGISGLLAGVPRIILSFRNYNPSHFSYLRNDWFQRYYQVLAHSPRIALSGNSRDANADYAQWIGVQESRVSWIPNCIDRCTVDRPSSDRLMALRGELSLPPGVPILLGVFRFSEEKRPRFFLEVCSRLIKAMPELHVLIAGAGPLEDVMVQFIDESNLQRHVRILGRREDVASLMGIASLLLLTSKKEGMPNVVMEAQLLGVPVVAARTGSVADLVENGESGFTLDSDDPADFARACLVILRDVHTAKTMGALGTVRMEKVFSSAVMAESYMRLVNEETRESI